MTERTELGLQLEAGLREAIAHRKGKLALESRHVEAMPAARVREIRRSLNYHQSQLAESTTDNQVSVLVLTGGGARLVGLANYMEHKLGLKTLAAGVFDNPRFNNTTGRQDAGQDLSVAVGLAMRAHSKAA